MALINCPECNREVSDKVKTCPHCGFPFVEETNKVDITSVSIARNMTKKQKRTILLSLVLVVVIVIVAIIGINFIKNTNEKKAIASESIAASEAVIKYEDNLNLAVELIFSSGVIMEDITNDVKSTWSSAIDNDNDFNDKIQEYYEKSSVIANIDTLSVNDTTITGLMKLLNNPTAGNERAYDELLVLYDAYQGLYNQAKSPSGSLTTYSSDVNGKIDAFITSYNKIDTLLP